MENFHLQSIPLDMKRLTWDLWVDSNNNTLEYYDWSEEANR